MSSTSSSSSSSFNSVESLALHGFGSHNQRRDVWYMLYGVTNPVPLSTLPKLPSYHPQILLDVHRSFHFDTCTEWTPPTRHRKLEALSYILQSVFPIDTDGPPYYVQGIHDIASVLVLNTGGNDTGSIDVLKQLVEVQLLGYVQPDMQVTLALLHLIERILMITDPVLLRHIRCPEGTDDDDDDDDDNRKDTPSLPPFFAIPWILTWFSHSTDRLHIITRLFDIFLVHHPLVPIYVVAALLVAYRHEILGINSTELYLLLQNLPSRITINKSLNNKKSNSSGTPTPTMDPKNETIDKPVSKKGSKDSVKNTPQSSFGTPTRDEKRSKSSSSIMFRRESNQRSISIQDLLTLTRILYFHIPPSTLLRALLDSKPENDESYPHLQTLKERWNDIFYWDTYFPTGNEVFGLSIDTYRRTKDSGRDDGGGKKGSGDSSSSSNVNYLTNPIIQHRTRYSTDHNHLPHHRPNENEKSNFVNITECLDEIHLPLPRKIGPRKYNGICGKVLPNGTTPFYRYYMTYYYRLRNPSSALQHLARLRKSLVFSSTIFGKKNEQIMKVVTIREEGTVGYSNRYRGSVKVTFLSVLWLLGLLIFFRLVLVYWNDSLYGRKKMTEYFEKYLSTDKEKEL